MQINKHSKRKIILLVIKIDEFCKNEPTLLVGRERKRGREERERVYDSIIDSLKLFRNSKD